MNIHNYVIHSIIVRNPNYKTCYINNRELVFLYRMADDRARSDAVDTLRKHQIKDTENKAI